jgi:hypothetical protein
VAFWVYGRDSKTGKPAEFFSDADTEDAARAEAGTQGIIVDRVERHAEASAPPSSAITATPPRQPAEPAGARGVSSVPPPGRIGWFSWICLTVGQVVSIFGCIGAIVGTLQSLSASTSGYKVLGVVEVTDKPDWFSTLVIGFCAFCYSAAMCIVFLQAKERHQS